LDQAEARAVLEQVQTHRRVALGYLQTGNADLALVEMERLRDLLESQGAGQPWAEPALTAALASARTQVEQSIKAAESGELERAGALMTEASGHLDAWRRNAGLPLFSDCIARAGSAYEALDIHRRMRPDLSDTSVRRRIVEAAAVTERALAQCDAEAPPDVRAEPEFRRLMDGFTASLKLVPDAAEKQDADYLYRLLIEQRAFDRLLAFRFG
jgi:hypothetical protein